MGTKLMKFLFRSGWGESLAIARRVEAEGNLVRFSIVEPTARTVGQGLIPKTNDFMGSIGWADIIVFDSNPFKMADEAEKCRKGGKSVIGSSALSGRLEKEREFATDFAKRCGLEVPEFVNFVGKLSWNEARKFLSTMDEESGWVWKSNGDSNLVSTYVAKNVPEMVRMLTYFENLHYKHKESLDFILSEKIDGVEVSTEAWFDGTNFLLANNTVERNRFFNDDLGEKTGCAGNVVWVYPTVEDCPLFEELLKPLAKELRGKYNGPIDVNAIIEKESSTPIFLEFTPRFGYDAIFAFAHLVESDLGGLFADVAQGRTWKGRVATDRFAGALRVHTPPYPEEEEGRAEGVPVFGFDSETVKRGVNPGEIRLDSEGLAETSGPTGYDFVLTAEGGTVKEAMDNCKPGLLKIPLMRYRTDLGEMLQDVYNDLEVTDLIKGPTAGSIFSKVEKLEDKIG